MRNFLKSINQTAFSLSLANKFNFVSHYTDIVPLRNALNPFFVVGNNKVDLFPEKTLHETKKELAKNFPDVKKINVFEASSFAEYSESTPMSEIIKNDFIYQVNNQFYYKVIPGMEQKEFKYFELQKNFIPNDEKEIFSFQENLGSQKVQSYILSNFVKTLMNEVNKINSSKVDPYYLKIAVNKSLGEMALKEITLEQDLNNQVKCLQNKLNSLEFKRDVISKQLEKKGHRRVKYFLGFTLTQIALVQYGTYVAFSWDIMEPFTCLLGVFDLIIGYSFWLYSNREYSFGDMRSHYVFRRLNKYLNKELNELSTLKNDYEEEINTIQKLLSSTLIQKEVFKSDWQGLRNYFIN